MRSKGLLNFSIGNDVVDLKAEDRPLHSRYIERVFTRREKEWIGHNTARLWECWAVKESAYKALKRVRKECSFSPMLFEYLPERSGVRYQDMLLYVTCKTSSEMVYAVCALSRATFVAVVKSSWVVDITSDARFSKMHPSEAVRKLLLIKLASSKRTVRRLLVSAPDPTVIPQLLISGESVKDLISFSHDGRFVLASYLEMCHRE
ncbi:MAG: 4-phosphopantetheinyl transferase family protein [Bdellovibrionales bacterium]|nr:4-phosphopantetheinyl transferase family protein [Bdellovibrionales bacterium]